MRGGTSRTGRCGPAPFWSACVAHGGPRPQPSVGYLLVARQRVGLRPGACRGCGVAARVRSHAPRALRGCAGQCGAQRMPRRSFAAHGRGRSRGRGDDRVRQPRRPRLRGRREPACTRPPRCWRRWRRTPHRASDLPVRIRPRHGQLPWAAWATTGASSAAIRTCSAAASGTGSTRAWCGAATAASTGLRRRLREPREPRRQLLHQRHRPSRPVAEARGGRGEIRLPAARNPPHGGRRAGVRAAEPQCLPHHGGSTTSRGA